jgi:hypothetical protein
MKKTTKEPKAVTIGTPAYGGHVTVGYAKSLAASVALFQSYGIKLNAILLTGSSVIQMARNKVLSEFLKSDSDMLVWIDADILWNANDLLKLCLHDEEVVAATYRKKIPTSTQFTVQLIRGKLDPDERGLLEVDRVGTGFMRVTREALKDLVSEADKLTVNSDDKTISVGKTTKYSDEDYKFVYNVFEIGVYKGEFLSEDYLFCEKLKEKGYKIMLDTKIVLGHEGTHVFHGEMEHFLKYIKEVDEKPKSENKVD